MLAQPAAQSLLAQRPCTVSALQVELTRAPPGFSSAPCRLSRCAGAHGTPGTGWHGRLRASASQLALALCLVLAAQRGALNGTFMAG
jgi:hypothetical protein